MAKKSEVEIISRMVVRPSSPTPHIKRLQKLSLLDHQAYPGYAPLIYCPNKSLSTLSLRKSLSKTLELFYPFAGQLNDSFTFIECNDHGVYFVESRISSDLSRFLRNPDPKTVTELLPFSDPKTCTEATRNNAITLVQLTVFSCGRIVIGVEVCHKIAARFPISHFARTWAAISAGNHDMAPPDFASSLRPSPFSPAKRVLRALNGPRSRRFVFSSIKLANLKKRIQQNGGIDFSPSTLEAVSSLLFRCVVTASRACALQQTINLHERLTPPQPKNSAGHFLLRLLESAESKRVTELHEITSNIRNELTDFFSDGREEMLKGEALVSMVAHAVEEETEQVMSLIGMNLVTFLSSLCLYETDFGWHELALVTSPLFFDKCFAMTYSKSGQDIEVWATLEENVMEKFETNQELLAFASTDVAKGHSRL